MSTRSRVTQLETTAPSGGNALLVLVGLGVAFLLITALLNVAKSGGYTPSDVLGIVRWVLLGVLVAGGAAALAGPVMLRLSLRRGAAGG